MRITTSLFVLFALHSIGGCRNASESSGAPNAAAGGSGETGSANEFDRFAEYATMDSYQNEIEFDRCAPWRAVQLKNQSWTEPAIKEAMKDFSDVSFFRHEAVLKRDGTYWESADIRESIATQVFGADSARNKDLVKGIRGTVKKVQDLAAAKKDAFDCRVAHSIIWDHVLSSVHPTGGPDRVNFPLRVGISFGPFMQNTSSNTLHHLTVAIRTNISNELPDDARLHVVHLEEMEPGEWFSLPEYLVSKIRDTESRTYRAESNVWRISVWSAECKFEDVDFDAQALPVAPADPQAAPNGWCRIGFFPTTSFKGKYDAKAVWRSPTLTPRSAALRGVWIGEDPTTKRKYKVRLWDYVGSDFNGTLEASMVPDDGTTYGTLIRGKLRGDKIVFENTLQYPNRPNVPSRYWGTIGPEQMDLKFGEGKTAEGTLTLKFLKAKD